MIEKPAVLLSIRPEWVAKILNGEKTLEIRKTRPKLEPPFRCYIYETGGKGVVASFLCDRVSTIWPDDCIDRKVVRCVQTDTGLRVEAQCALYDGIAIYGSALTADEVVKYAGWTVSVPLIGNHPIYGWHISDVRVSTIPGQLSQLGLKRPPQSWQYIKEQKTS